MSISSTKLLVIGSLALAVTAYGGSPGPSEDPNSTPSTKSTTSINEPASPDPTTPERSSEPEVVDPVPPSDTEAAAAVPTVTECIYGGGSWTGTGFMSDGSVGWAAECQQLRDDQLAATPHRCPQTDHYVADLAECGAAPAPENGAVAEPPPAFPEYETSGEAQTHNMCQSHPESVDPAICAELDAKYGPRWRSGSDG